LERVTFCSVRQFLARDYVSAMLYHAEPQTAQAEWGKHRQIAAQLNIILT
jgi:hypothetical protein